MKKFKSKKGFTLIEVVTVVGIIAVLCAITIIPISKMGSSLDKQQENNYAKDIYIAVQDELASLRTDGSIRKLADKGFTSVYASTGESPELCNEVKELLTGDYADLQAELIGEDLKREYVYVMGTGDNAISSVLPAGKIDSTIFSDSIEVAVIFNKMSGDVLFVKYGENGRYSGKVVNQADKIKIDTEKITPVIKIVQDEECYVSVTVQVPQEMRSADGLIKFRDGLKYDITMKDTGSDTEYNYEYLGSGEYDTFTSSYHSGSCEAKWSVDSMIEGLHF
ncbi:MAG: type II secretion system GspH family protein, partial [Clostridia bacterium]|nr:type II secretion system GspH family protein [Clostridia bacterium]